MRVQGQELIEWLDGVPAERMQFVRVRQHILAVNPGAYSAMLARIHRFCWRIYCD